MVQILKGMKVTKNILAFAISVAALFSCRHDDIPAATFVEDIAINFTYGEYGSSLQYPEPLQVVMNNNTEQIEYEFSSDLLGNVLLTRLLPGDYTMNISGKLSEDRNLSGFMSGLVLRIGRPSSFEVPQLFESAASPLVFKEIYYAGSPTPTGGTYRNDNFYTVFNNSDEEQDISTLYIGMCENFGGLGETGPLWPGEETGNYSHVYLKSVWKITAGDDPVYLAPGQLIVIASMAAPHNRDEAYNLSSPVDLSGADYEAYVPDPENMYPNFDSPDMELAFWPSYSYLWRMGVFGQGMVLLQATREEFEGFEVVTLPETFQDPFEDDEYWLCKKVPNAFVCDAVDIIQNSTVSNTKRFSPVLDAGFATVGETYCGKSIIRKPLYPGAQTLMDTNNSSLDFEVNDNPSAE